LSKGSLIDEEVTKYFYYVVNWDLSEDYKPKSKEPFIMKYNFPEVKLLYNSFLDNSVYDHAFYLKLKNYQNSIFSLVNINYSNMLGFDTYNSAKKLILKF